MPVELASQSQNWKKQIIALRMKTWVGRMRKGLLLFIITSAVLKLATTAVI
jgi:hypothetical protein